MIVHGSWTSCIDVCFALVSHAILTNGKHWRLVLAERWKPSSRGSIILIHSHPSGQFFEFSQVTGVSIPHGIPLYPWWYGIVQQYCPFAHSMKIDLYIPRRDGFVKGSDTQRNQTSLSRATNQTIQTIVHGVPKGNEAWILFTETLGTSKKPPK